MSERIPIALRDRVSENARKLLDIVARFVEEECIPAEPVYESLLETEQHGRWGHPRIMEDLKKKAEELGLWNIFLPSSHYKEGAGLSNLEYGLIAEYLGKSTIASEATNCAAPDTGNMEVLAKFGTKEQKKDWLEPLMAGTIRSAYVMTEPGVASSDATNIRLSMKREGNAYILNGRKWWISGAASARCKLYIVFAQSDHDHPDPHKRHSIILVPSDTPGITVKRTLKVFGFDDAPHGHAELIFNDVRLPASNVILGPGRGFEVMQGRMGPGRIHHAMRAIGAAEKALEWMLMRSNDRNKMPFNKLLSDHGSVVQWIARSRVEIDAARLIVLNAAVKIDETNAKDALTEIAEAKILVPRMTLTVIDRAVQIFGAEGVCQDTPLAQMWAYGRTLRISDGPDEVHLQQLGRRENKRSEEVASKIRRQREATKVLFERYGLASTDARASKL